MRAKARENYSSISHCLIVKTIDLQIEKTNSEKDLHDHARRVSLRMR